MRFSFGFCFLCGFPRFSAIRIGPQIPHLEIAAEIFDYSVNVTDMELLKAVVSTGREKEEQKQIPSESGQKIADTTS